MLLRKKIILCTLFLICRPTHGMVHMLQHVPQSRPAQLFNQLDLGLSHYLSVHNAVLCILFLSYAYSGTFMSIHALDKINDYRNNYKTHDLNKALRSQAFAQAQQLLTVYKKMPEQQATADLLQNTIPYLITKESHLLHINAQWHEKMASYAAIRKSLPHVAHHIIMTACMLWLLRVGISTLNRACVQPFDSILYPTTPVPPSTEYAAQDPLIMLLQTAFMVWQIMHRPQ